MRKPNRETATAKRRGAVAVLIAFLLVPLMGLVALGVDYGYLLVVRTDLQRAADAAVLAAVQDLVPKDEDGTQDLAAVRATLRQYAAENVSDVANFSVLDDDIEIGRYDPEAINSGLVLLDDGLFDTVRVKLRRDASANSPVSLFFSRIFGRETAGVSVTATAVLQKASILGPGADVLPITIQDEVWNSQPAGSVWSIYGDGRILDELGTEVPGNWGTLNIGSDGNSTSDMSDQILNGLRQVDLDALYANGRIPQSTHIDSADPWFSNADTGLSAGMKHAIQAVHGQKKLVPIYDTTTGNGGNNFDFHIIAWGVVEVVDSGWNGSDNSHVTVKKAFTYKGDLRPHADLSNPYGAVDGAFTTPVLIQ